MDASNIESFNAAAMEAVNAMPAPTPAKTRRPHPAKPDPLEEPSKEIVSETLE